MTKKTLTELKRALRLYAREARKVRTLQRGTWDAENRMHVAIAAVARQCQDPLRTALGALDDSLGAEIVRVDAGTSALGSKLDEAEALLA